MCYEGLIFIKGTQNTKTASSIFIFSYCTERTTMHAGMFML